MDRHKLPPSYAQNPKTSHSHPNSPSHRPPTPQKSMSYVPYEICSYARRIKMYRGKGTHGTRLIKFSHSVKKNTAAVCNQHQSNLILMSPKRHFENEKLRQHEMMLNTRLASADNKWFGTEECPSCAEIKNMRLQGHRATLSNFYSPNEKMDIEVEEQNNNFKTTLGNFKNDKLKNTICQIPSFRPLNLSSLSSHQSNPINVVREAIRSRENIRYNDDSPQRRSDANKDSIEAKRSSRPIKVHEFEPNADLGTNRSFKPGGTFVSQKFSLQPEMNQTWVTRMSGGFMPQKYSHRGSMNRTSFINDMSQKSQSGQSSPMRNISGVPLKIMVKKY